MGAPVPVEDLLAAAVAQRWSDDELYRRIADRIGLALQELDARLHDRQLLDEVPCIDDDALMPLIGTLVCGFAINTNHMQQRTS